MKDRFGVVNMSFVVHALGGNYAAYSARIVKLMCESIARSSRACGAVFVAGAGEWEELWDAGEGRGCVRPKGLRVDWLDLQGGFFQGSKHSTNSSWRLHQGTRPMHLPPFSAPLYMQVMIAHQLRTPRLRAVQK